MCLHYLRNFSSLFVPAAPVWIYVPWVVLFLVLPPPFLSGHLIHSCKGSSIVFPRLDFCPCGGKCSLLFPWDCWCVQPSRSSSDWNGNVSCEKVVDPFTEKKWVFSGNDGWKYLRIFTGNFLRRRWHLSPSSWSSDRKTFEQKSNFGSRVHFISPDLKV